MTPLERKFRGGGEVYTKEPSVGGGDGYFLESHSHRKETKNENSEVHVKPRKRAKDSPRPIY